MKNMNCGACYILRLVYVEPPPPATSGFPALRAFSELSLSLFNPQPSPFIQEESGTKRVPDLRYLTLFFINSQVLVRFRLGKRIALDQPT